MNALLDTRAIIWFIEGDPSLSKKAKEIIVDGSNKVLLVWLDFMKWPLN